MPAITDGTLTTASPHYYNSALDTTGGYVEVTDGALAFLDVYASAKLLVRYGTTTPTSPRIAVVAAGSTVTFPRDPNKRPDETWQLFVKAASGTVEVSVTGHNNGGFRTG